MHIKEEFAERHVLTLTVDNEAQAWARAEEKGRDAARVAVEMANLLEDM